MRMKTVRRGINLTVLGTPTTCSLADYKPQAKFPLSLSCKDEITVFDRMEKSGFPYRQLLGAKHENLVLERGSEKGVRGGIHVKGLAR